MPDGHMTPFPAADSDEAGQPGWDILAQMRQND
jgi:hypothetical protein